MQKTPLELASLDGARDVGESGHFGGVEIVKLCLQENQRKPKYKSTAEWREKAGLWPIRACMMTTWQKGNLADRKSRPHARTHTYKSASNIKCYGRRRRHCRQQQLLHWPSRQMNFYWFNFQLQSGMTTNTKVCRMLWRLRPSRSRSSENCVANPGAMRDSSIVEGLFAQFVLILFATYGWEKCRRNRKRFNFHPIIRKGKQFLCQQFAVTICCNDSLSYTTPLSTS